MKLILLNGPTGIGKSTIAHKIHQVLPLSFLLDIDAQRRFISAYKEHREESLNLVLKLSYAIIDSALQNGRDVVIDKVLTDIEASERFLELGRKYGAVVYEFVLNADKETLIARANERGYIEGSMLTPEKVPEFWDRMQSYIKERPQAVVIDTKNLSIEETFEYIRGKIFDKD
jgi:predicted kinase